MVALGITRLLRRQAAKAGYAMSVRELLATLAGIQETVLVYPSTDGRPRARRMTSEMDTTQARRLVSVWVNPATCLACSVGASASPP